MNDDNLPSSSAFLLETDETGRKSQRINTDDSEEKPLRPLNYFGGEILQPDSSLSKLTVD